MVSQDEWVVCRVFHKNNNNNNVNGGIRRDVSIMQRTPTTADSFLDHILNSPSELPPLMDLHDDNRLPPLPPGGAASGSSAQLISEEDEDEDGDGEKFTQEESNFQHHILMPNYNHQAFKNSYQLDMMMMMRNNNSPLISPSQDISSTSTSTSMMKKIGRNPSRTFDQLGQELDVGNPSSLSDLDSLWDYRDY